MEQAIFKDLFHVNSLISFAALLLAGLTGGQLAHYTRFLPKITGYIVIGFLLGPHGIGILNNAILEKTQIFSDLAIGLILFQLGLQINISELMMKKYLLLVGFFESTLSFLFIFFALSIFIEKSHALLIAAIGISASPAITLLIANEFNARGPVIKHSLFLTAFNNILAFCFYMIAMTCIQLRSFKTGSLHLSALLYPLHYLFWPIILAFLLSKIMMLIGRLIGKQENSQFALLIGMLVLSIGLAKSLHISSLLTSLLLGIFVINFDKKKTLMEVEFGHSGEIFFVILFVIAGTHLELASLLTVGKVALIFIIARFAGKIIPIMLMSRDAALDKKQRAALAVTLLPLAGAAISLLGVTSHLNSKFSAEITTIVLSAIAILETIGPILTFSALKLIGELDEHVDTTH